MDLGEGDTADLLALTSDLAARPQAYEGALDGRHIGLLFTAVSTRTRTAFWRAAVDLGAQVLGFGSDDLQLRTGETWGDTGLVLAQYLDAVVVRTNGPLTDMRALAERLPATVNALSHEEHPTQALADYCAMHERFGGVEGLRLAYVGAGNNTAAALALLMSRVPGVRCDFYCPPGDGLPEDVAAAASAYAARAGACFRRFADVPADPDPVDVVYTTRWQSMGVPRTEQGWRDRFEPFRVTTEAFARLAGGGAAVFMHDLPATRGEEVVSEVLDAPQSIVSRQAYHKRTAAGAALLWCLGHGALDGTTQARWP